MERSEHGGYKVYILTWFWLLVITALEVSITLVHMPKALMASLLILLALMKVVLIAAYFMHLRFERLSLVYVAITPLVFAAILFFALVPDAVRIPGIR